jgi:hypothetical protein
LGGLVVTGGLLERPDPVDALGILRIDGNRLLKTCDRRCYFVQLEKGFAEQMVDAGVLRALALQLDQDRLGDEILLGGHQRLNHVGARRPMPWIELQGLKVELDGPLVLAAPQVQVAEAAPAIR